MRKFTDQEIDAAYNVGHEVIQHEIDTGYETAEVINAFGPKYSLAAEAICVIAELTRNTILGLVGQQEFLKDLLAERIPEAQAKEIWNEIYRSVLSPLREQIRGGGAAEKDENGALSIVAPGPMREPKPALPPPPRAVPPPQVQMPIYSAPPLQSPRYVRTEDEVAAFKSAPQPKAAMPTAGPAATPPTAPAINLAAKPPSTEIAPKMQALPVGEEVPRAAPQPAPAAPQPAPSMPVPAAAPAQPSPAPAEPKLRLAEPEALPPQPKVFVTPAVPVRPPSADDPYREPIDQM